MKQTKKLFSLALFFAALVLLAACLEGKVDFFDDNKDYEVKLIVEQIEFANKVHIDVEKAKANTEISFTVDPVEMYLPPIIRISSRGVERSFKTEMETTTFVMPYGDAIIKIKFSNDPGFDATLSTLSALEKDLAPEFNMSTTAYSVELPAGSTLLTLNYSASAQEAVLSEASPRNVALNEGRNIIEIGVTSPNGQVTMNYVIEALVMPTLVINGITIKSAVLADHSFTQTPDNLEFARLPYISTGNKAGVSVDATDGAVIEEGGGEFDLSVGDDTTRDITVSRTVDGLTNTQSFTVVIKVFEGNIPAWKVGGADVLKKVYLEGAWHEIHVFSTAGTKTAEVFQAFTGELFVVGGGAGGNGAHNVGSWQSGGGGSGGAVVRESGYSFAAQDYEVVVGAGGNGGGTVGGGGNRNNTRGGVGAASSFDGITASGGALYSQDVNIQKDGYNGPGAMLSTVSGEPLFYGEKGLKGRSSNAEAGQSVAAGRGGNGGRNNSGGMSGGKQGYSGVVIIRD
ncbi:MAG: cadherin-like beta sandwich domain-containing protein [Spirochaetaceae bacterium]|nr:cadherin-like beta sandwich domain-containing protein [Spirochaetaceae bacterium]